MPINSSFMSDTIDVLDKSNNYHAIYTDDDLNRQA